MDNIQIILICVLIFLIIFSFCQTINIPLIIGGGIGFPYIREWHTDNDIKNMMDNLKKYNGLERILHKKYNIYNLKNIKLTYLGKPTLIINKESDYNDFNKLSDMFQEKCRMKCSVKNKISPLMYYEHLPSRDKIKNKQKLRERIWKENSECTGHRPNILSTFIQMYGSKSVLDFTSGWGDRLISAIANEVEYCGIDSNPCLFPNYKKMINFFNVSDEKYIMIESKAQDAIIPDKKYDLIFTSPPYFDYENYYNEVKDTEKEWFNSFLSVCLKKYWEKLIKNGHMCININHTSPNQNFIYWMLNYVKEFDDSKYLGVISYANINIKNPQPIWIWKKI